MKFLKALNDLRTSSKSQEPCKKVFMFLKLIQLMKYCFAFDTFSRCFRETSISKSNKIVTTVSKFSLEKRITKTTKKTTKKNKNKQTVQTNKQTKQKTGKQNSIQKIFTVQKLIIIFFDKISY